MIVLDASAAVEWLLQTPAGHRVEHRIYSRNETLHAPHVLDLEVTQVLRRLVQQGTLTPSRGDEALRDMLDLRILRYPHSLFVPRIWQLRHNLSAYDAAYVALAEEIKGVLITRDHRLASAAGHSASIEVF
jgi:predicted nucleic acid-binding protein